MSRIKSLGTLVFVLILVLLFLLLIVLPALASFVAHQSDDAPGWLIVFLNFSEGFTRWSMLIFVLIWIFALGGTFASFLNVVAWRVPRGKSILGSSYCPNCTVKLSFKDNIPFIGWIKNGGRCSNCKNPISIRYLIVELVLGAIFLLIAALVTTSGGASLPFLQPEVPSDWFSMILYPHGELLQIIVFHWTLAIVLYTFALIELERLRIPLNVWLVGAFFGLLFLAIWPTVTVVDWQFPFGQMEMNRWLNLAVFVTCGLCFGLFNGWLLDRCQFVDGQANSFIFGLTTVGMFLGWQSTLIVSCLAAILMLIQSRFEPASTAIKNMLHSPHANLLLATLIHLASWRWLQFV